MPLVHSILFQYMYMPFGNFQLYIIGSGDFVHLFDASLKIQGRAKQTDVSYLVLFAMIKGHCNYCPGKRHCVRKKVGWDA